MKELDNFGLEEVREDELVMIDGGSELSDALVRGAGWLVGQAVNLGEAIGRGAKFLLDKQVEMIVETGGLPHAY
ncbi:hypothetical protein QYZ87_04390 [Porphyromonadaceae bacterium W3.11]|nr:hypothetical protein [Porphyromonadaceae bacterium W3.11]